VAPPSIMSRYLLWRLVIAVPVLFLATVAVFFSVRLIPGDPALNRLGMDATPDQVRALRTELALQRPLPEQYVVWLGHALRGDFGESQLNRQPTTHLVLAKVPATLELGVTALCIGLAIAIPLGLVSALRQRSVVNLAGMLLSSLTMAIPTFWLGVIFILVFALRLRWLPATGRVAFFDDPIAAVRHLAMPAFTLGIVLAGILTRFIKTSTLDVLGHAYVTTAHAKGVPQRRVLVRHVLRNAAIPITTVLGLQMGTLLTGAVVTEAVFDWPGIGSLVVYSVLNKDYTVVQATVMLFVLLFLGVNLVVDGVYALLDPRIRLG
jgi:peptide/nickel transport system permease protein